jgi:putative transposase
VDQDGDVLDILVPSRRDKKAAKKFFRKLLKGLRYVPTLIITDKLQSYSAAKSEVLPSVEHCQDSGRTIAPRIHSADQLAGAGNETVQVRATGAAFSFGLWDHHLTLPTGRHLCTARSYREIMKCRFTAWKQVVGPPEAV